MYFEKEENRIFTPLKNAHKGDVVWQKAYQAVKHSRVENLHKVDIIALVRGMAALYLLNVYYRDDVFEVGNIIDGERALIHQCNQIYFL